MVIIRKVGPNDQIVDVDGVVHGFFTISRNTVRDELQRVREKKKLKELRNAGNLYKIESTIFTCTYAEQNYRGYDISISLELEIDIEEHGNEFIDWVRRNGNYVWDAEHEIIYASSLETCVQEYQEFGLRRYIHDEITEQNLGLLIRNGVESWGNQGGVGVNWLKVNCARSVDFQPHKRRRVSVERGTVLCGRYELLEMIGHGGMGQVWKARNNAFFNRLCAIKILAEGANEALVETIRNEANVLWDLGGHNNVVTMRGYEQEGNVSFMVMDYIDGTSLADKVRINGMFNVNEIGRWLNPIAHAIDCVHERGIVHRDIKPSNVLVGHKENEENNIPYLCDFGIARRNGDVTLIGGGTPGYCAPEVAPGKMIDAKADVYSFAATIVYCLTGRHPTSRGYNCEELPDDGIFRRLKSGLSIKPEDRPERCTWFFEENDESLQHESKVDQRLLDICNQYRVMLTESSRLHNHQKQTADFLKDMQGRLYALVNTIGVPVDLGDVERVFDDMRSKYAEFRQQNRGIPFFVEHRRLNVLYALENAPDAIPYGALRRSIQL